MDKSLFSMIKDSEIQAKIEYNKIKKDTPLIIEKTLYDKAREKFKENRDSKLEEDIKEDENDILKQFLEKKSIKLVNGKIEKYDDAVEIKNEVLQKMKERVIARAKIIQERLQTQQDHLKHLEEQYQKKQEEKNERELAEVKFKIGILESRSSRFEALAITKFQELDSKLNNDPRLDVLKDRKW